jgi:type I protein arginine methyltransferase
MYSVSAYGFMIADETRMAAHVAALHQAIKPDSVVLDIGAGTGIFTLLACRFGARRVYAIEPADAIQVAREAVAANGYADRVEFLQNLSTKVTLPELADVIICDLRGQLPFLGDNIVSIADARRRLLKPGGILIPQCDQIRVAVMEAETVYNKNLDPWYKYDFDLSAARRIVTNNCGWDLREVNAEMMLAAPQLWAELDYTQIENPDVTGEVSFVAERAGTAHGLLIWFDTKLRDDIGFSNAPDSNNPTKVYGRSFFPLAQPVRLEAQDQIKVRFDARLVDNNYIYRWATTVTSPSAPHKAKAQFDQSTFFGVPLSISGLRKQREDYVPELELEGQIDHFILAAMEQRMPLGAIARKVSERFQTRFPEWQIALTRVSALSEKYSR